MASGFYEFPELLERVLVHIAQKKPPARAGGFRAGCKTDLTVSIHGRTRHLAFQRTTDGIVLTRRSG